MLEHDSSPELLLIYSSSEANPAIKKESECFRSDAYTASASVVFSGDYLPPSLTVMFAI